MSDDDLLTRECVGALQSGEHVTSWTVRDYDRLANRTIGIPRAPTVEALSEEPQDGVLLWVGRNPAQFLIIDAEAYRAQMRALLGLE